MIEFRERAVDFSKWNEDGHSWCNNAAGGEKK